MYLFVMRYLVNPYKVCKFAAFLHREKFACYKDLNRLRSTKASYSKKT